MASSPLPLSVGQFHALGDAVGTAPPLSPVRVKVGAETVTVSRTAFWRDGGSIPGVIVSADSSVLQGDVRRIFVSDDGMLLKVWRAVTPDPAGVAE